MRLEPSRDDGAGAIMVIAISSIVIVAFVIALVVTDLLSARARAAAAADLGALAGAPAASRSDYEACAAAEWIVRHNNATLRRCRVIDGDIWVTASSRPRAPWSRWWAAVAAGSPEPQVTARAGLR